MIPPQQQRDATEMPPPQSPALHKIMTSRCVEYSREELAAYTAHMQAQHGR